MLGLLVGSVDNPSAGQLHRAVEDIPLTEAIAVFAASLHEDPERAAAATRHPVVAGHRRTAYLGDEIDIQAAQEGNRGFLLALPRTTAAVC